MRYHYTSWNDLDQALESLRYARRALLVAMAVALPFAAWESWSGHSTHAGDVVNSPAATTVEFTGAVQDEACADAAPLRKLVELRTYIG